MCQSLPWIILQIKDPYLDWNINLLCRSSLLIESCDQASFPSVLPLLYIKVFYYRLIIFRLLLVFQRVPSFQCLMLSQYYSVPGFIMVTNPLFFQRYNICRITDRAINTMGNTLYQHAYYLYLKQLICCSVSQWVWPTCTVSTISSFYRIFLVPTISGTSVLNFWQRS